MNIKIKDVITKPEWIEKLGVFLHDSEIDRDRRWDKTQKEFEIAVTRIHYEGAQYRRLLWCIPIWRYHTISAKLVIAPVEDVSDKRREGRGVGEPELLLFIELLSERVLEIESSFGITRLTLGSGAYMEARDVGVPLPKARIINLFRRIVDPKLVEQISRASVV